MTVMRNPHYVAFSQFQFRRVEYRESFSLIQRQRRAVHLDTLAPFVLFGVLMELQYVAMQILERVAALSFSEIGVFQYSERPLCFAELTALLECAPNLIRDAFTFKMRRRDNYRG